MLAVYGDAPHGTSPADTTQFLATPAFIAAINADPDVSMVLHVGDIHSGKQYCSEAYDRAIYNMWGAFEAPLIYTPGDNEWTDCHKGGEGGGTYNATTGQIDYVLDSAGNPVDYDLANFHRIVVHGSTLPLEWLKVTIGQPSATPDSFGPFVWQRVIP